MLKIEFLGHSCFMLQDGAHNILIDPFLTGNPLAAKTADEVNPDFIFITHAHGDHIGDCVAIAKRTGAVVYGVPELAETLLTPAGIKTAIGNLGGRQATPFGSVKYLPASHTSGIPGGLACGYLFEIGGKKVYHAGDTALIPDLALLAAEHIDVALLPIGDVFTMGPKDALEATAMIAPKVVIPMHYNTFPFIIQDPAVFKQTVEAKLDCSVCVLAPGKTYEL